MDWKEKALKDLIAQLIVKDQEKTDFVYQLGDLGITIDREELDPIYYVLKDMTEWEYLAENLEGYRDETFTLEQITDFVYEYIEEKYKVE